MKFAPQQEKALATAVAWLRIRYAPFFYLGGYAGTGKTTLARHIAGQIDGEVRFAAYTGKAAKVMRQSGCEGARTIHSMIYDVDEDPATGKLSRHLTSARVSGAKLIVIDECSMVDEEIARDLLSFGIPVIVLGDPGQLPPVKGQGFFTAGEPTFMLTDVHRQATDSPIIALATEIRRGLFDGRPRANAGLTVCCRNALDPTVVPAANTVIVGRNATRQRYNARLRELKGFTSQEPEPGDRLICLRNDREKSIANGEMFRLDRRRRSRRTDHGKVLNFTVTDPDDAQRAPIPVSVFEQSFAGKESLEAIPPKARRGTQEFTYGYAITCHKSQGSQWDDVVVFDESAVFRSNADRWLYTAVTRAAERLTLVLP